MEVFDIHRHLGFLGSIEDVPLTEQVDHHLSVMDDYGISRAAIMPSHAYPNPNGIVDTRELNDQLATVRDEYSDRFPVALGTVEPMYGSEGLEEIDRVMTDLDLDGVSWHNRWQRSYVDSPMMRDLVERSAEHDAVVLLHAYFESNLEEPWRVFRLIEDFPDVRFIIADPFSGLKEGKKTTHWASQLDRDNVLFDTSGIKHFKRQARAFIDQAGIEKFVFGAGGYSQSDATSFPAPLDQVHGSDLTEDEKEAFLRGNAKRIFDL